MKRFVVLAVYTLADVRHFTIPVIVTDNLLLALTAAAGAEKKGFRFRQIGDGVTVFCLEDGDVYAPEDFMWRSSSGSPPPSTLVFGHAFDPSSFRSRRTTWHDKELERLYGPACTGLFT